jgi:hypothetical protein
MDSQPDRLATVTSHHVNPSCCVLFIEWVPCLDYSRDDLKEEKRKITVTGS